MKNLDLFESLLLKIYKRTKVTFRGKDEIHFSAKKPPYPLHSMIRFLFGLELVNHGFEVTPVVGHIVHGYGLVLHSSTDFTRATTKEDSGAVEGEIHPNQKAYVLVLNKHQLTPSNIDASLRASLTTLSSFEFDGNGSVIRQPDPEAYREALGDIREALQGFAKGV